MLSPRVVPPPEPSVRNREPRLGESELPIDVILADDAPLLDVAGALRIPVAEFVQTTPVSLLEMLYEWEEMAGIPIDATPLDEEPSAIDRLRQNVTLTLSDTTLGEILAKLLAQAGLRYVPGPYGVRLHFSDPS